MSRRHTGSFIAKDSEGKRVVVNVFTEYVPIGTCAQYTEIPGLKSLRLESGTRVSRLSKGRYRTVESHERELTSDDPHAT